jgi:hypothetical protein
VLLVVGGDLVGRWSFIGDVGIDRALVHEIHPLASSPAGLQHNSGEVMDLQDPENTSVVIWACIAGQCARQRRFHPEPDS